MTDKADKIDDFASEIPKMSFKQAIESLTDIVDKVEAGDISVESSLNQYEKGMAIIKHCRGILQDAETKIKEISE